MSFVVFWERSSTYGLTFLKNYQLECFIKVGCHSVSGSETDILENFVHSVQFESRTSWVRHIQTRVMSTRDLEMASLKTAVAQAFHDVPRRSTTFHDVPRAELVSSAVPRSIEHCVISIKPIKPINIKSFQSFALSSPSFLDGILL